MIIKKIGVFSCAKISGILYALMGLIIGAIFSFISLVSSVFSGDLGGGQLMGMFFGIGAIILLPIFYGLLGFVSAAIGSWFYNLVAGWIGGIEIILEEQPPNVLQN
ncbi:MAG: hypothetical protein ABIE07_12425 [Candidatus Zixiibacteriota bacterium]